jgi:cathepsin A (carboxypeptidase C)
MNLARICYGNPDPAICNAASTVCWHGVVKFYDGESHKGGRNRYDITAPCDDDNMCYANLDGIQRYLNRPEIWQALEVPKAVGKYKDASDEINEAFTVSGDKGISTQQQVLYLLEVGVDVLIYQGMYDLACNTAVGNPFHYM